MIIKSRLLVGSLALFLVGCGSVNQFISRLPSEGYEHADTSIPELVSKPPRVNLNLYKSVEDSVTRPHQRSDVAIAIAASGGGYRAANLTAGVLLGLEEFHPLGVQQNLLQEVDYFSTVSGSGFAVGLYMTRLAHQLKHQSNTRPYSFAHEFYRKKEPLAELLRIDHSNDLLFGHTRSLRLESVLGHDLLDVDPEIPLLLGDIFVKRDDPRKALLPMWVTNATIIQNYELFQFTPDVISAYKINDYPHDYRMVPLKNLQDKLYGFDMPAVVGMMASATYPYAVDGTTLASRACVGPCYLQLFDGGLVDNIGVFSAIDLLRQDPAKVKVLIIVDAYNNNFQPFSKQQKPPQRLDLFSSVMKSIGSSFQRSMKIYAKHMARDILCENGAKKVLIVYLDIEKYPLATAVPTTLWMDPREQNVLVQTGKNLVQSDPNLQQILPQLLRGADVATC